MRLTIIALAQVFFALSCYGAPPSPKQEVIAGPVDSIVVIKHLRQLTAYAHHKVVKSYHVCLGPAPAGKKQFKDDGKTPEGLYYINGKNPGSHYHKSLGVSYPNDEDRAYASAHGRPTGGDIKIHGLPNSYKGSDDDQITDDWTLGCVALNNVEIDELYAHVAVGTPVFIAP
jgi:murein L,D-transpeptidase YafK